MRFGVLNNRLKSPVLQFQGTSKLLPSLPVYSQLSIFRSCGDYFLQVQITRSANQTPNYGCRKQTKRTVESRYLELGYVEFCDTRSVYMNQKIILVAFSNHDLALGTFLQVQITRSANFPSTSRYRDSTVHIFLIRWLPNPSDGRPVLCMYNILSINNLALNLIY